MTPTTTPRIAPGRRPADHSRDASSDRTSGSPPVRRPAPSTPQGLRAVWQSHLDAYDAAECARFGTGAPGHRHGHLLDTAAPDLLEPFVRGLLVDPPGPTDIVPFTGLDGDAAGQLLDDLAPRTLDDRQNAAPTLRAILEATATRPDRLQVHGYAVGPGRCDERVSAEGVYVRFDDALHLPRRCQEGCDCERLWSYVVDELGLDDDGAHKPDEILPAYRADDELWWRLWWD